MPLGDKVGDQTVKDLGAAVAGDIDKLQALAESILARLDGATLTVTLKLTPKP